MVDLFAITYPEVKKGTLALSDGVLEIDEVVRVVAHKRIVCRGRWGGLAVYAKIFIGKEANRYALRDETGVIALRQAGINTTDLLIATETLDGAHVLVSVSYTHLDVYKRQGVKHPSQRKSLRHPLHEVLAARV